MTRIVGSRDRSEFILDPVEAWHRGRVLDRMLAHVEPPRPHGVFRGTHAEFERIDEARRIELARALMKKGLRRARARKALHLVCFGRSNIAP